MAADAAITRAKERFEALRARDTVAIMYSGSDVGLPSLSPSHLPKHFRKFEGMRSFHFSPNQHRRGLLITHSACTESERLVIEAFRCVAEDLQEHLEAHKYTTCFKIRELDWAIALIEASHNSLLGPEGYGEVLWQDADSDLLVTGKFSEDRGKHLNIMDRYFIELNNAVEASLRLIEHLAVLPEAPQKPEPREKTADQKLQDLFEANPNFTCEASLRALAQELGLKSPSTLTATPFYNNVLKEKREVVKQISQQKQAAEKRIRSGNAHADDAAEIEAADKALDEYYSQYHQIDRER